MTNPTYTHMLSILAFHIKTLCLAEPGDMFSLSFYGDVAVDVRLGSASGLFYFRYTGQLYPVHIGSLENAIKTYTELCAPAFESRIVAQEQED